MNDLGLSKKFGREMHQTLHQEPLQGDPPFRMWETPFGG